MSSSVHHLSRSRTDSLGDRDAEEASFYMTPRPETPYTTPSSTPRLIHCRLNPVKTIRQHVPLKINFAQETQSSTPDQAALSKFNEVKPVNTKKVRCVIQPNPLYQDGDGDQFVTCTTDVPGELNSDTNAINAHCHSKGDAATAVISSDNQPADESVAVIEKEIDLMDEFVKGSIKRLQMCCDVKANSDGCDPPIADNCDKDSQKSEKAKNDKAKAPNKKNSCVENHDLPGGHKCEKKKFYDPEDIRKYMMRKKNQRHAKEKEEKHKKESEAMALKRKFEASKMLATKTRIPVARHHLNDREVENKLKNHQKVTQCSRGAEDVKIIRKSSCDGKQSENRRRHSHSVERHDNAENRREYGLANGNDQCVRHEYDKAFEHIDDTGDYFMKKFNDIIYKCAKDAVKMTASEIHQPVESDLLKRISTKVKSPEKYLKIHKRADSVPSLPKELDVLKSKNPYNFLNILKGKVNLAKHSNDTNIDELSDEHLIAKAFASSPAKRKYSHKSDKDKFLEDIIKRRLKLGHSAPLTIKLNELNSAEEPENVEPMINLRSEMALEDLQLSPVKSNETYRIWPAKKCDKTFTLHDDSDGPKNTSLLSGIRSLSASEERIGAKLFQDELSGSESNMPICDDMKINEKLCSNLNKTLSLESLKAHNVSLSLPGSFVRQDIEENYDVPMSRNLSMDFRKLLEDESIFGKGIRKGVNGSSFVGKKEDRALGYDIQRLVSNESSIFSSDDLANLSTTAVFLDIYDQMMKSEDEKLTQILKKIHQQKEALNKYLKTEVLALESKKNIYRESKDEEQIKTIKKRQRAILLKITKNIQELDKMKKSVIETVERRKAEILRQKTALKEKKDLLKQKISVPKKKKIESPNRTFLVSKPANSLFMGISSSSTSFVFENRDNRADDENEEDEAIEFHEKVVEKMVDKSAAVKDTATSPVHFNTGISIRQELDPEKLLKLKSPCDEMKIDASKIDENGEKINNSRSLCLEPGEHADNVVQNKEHDVEDRSRKIKIKRPLSPIVLPSTKKISQMRRLSSSSDVTFASFNETTTDQSDVELRISALQEQLRQRKLEAERLRREEKQLRKEKLRAKEQSLRKQLEAYDQYIQRVTKMLSEDRSIAEIAKPQIKQTKRPSFSEPSEKRIKTVDLNETLTQSDREDVCCARNQYMDDVDAENTEDSDKHLRKADSGILMESEVTEVSENVEIRKSKSESEIHSEGNSERVEKSDVQHAGGSKSVDNFLQLINDIQSEVVSMSEQVYSSDFVEDIPEDIPDSKSETSVINDYNTSVSIEEILSDHADPSDTDPKPSSIVEQVKAKKSRIEISEQRSPITSEHADTEIKESKTEESDSDHMFIVKNISDIESADSDQVKPTIAPQSVETEIDDASEHVKPSKLIDSSENIDSEHPPAEKFQLPGTASEPTPVEEMKTAISENSAIGEIKSVSSLETVTADVKETSMFFDFSRDDQANEAAINHEFVKYESEGSSVPDVDEPVRKVDDIETMMDGFGFSIDSNNVTQTEQISPKVQKNFDEVLKNLESYFSMKISPVDTEDVQIESFHDTSLGKDLHVGAKAEEKELPEKKVSEIGFEETDISESLEYDTSAENSDQRCKIELTVEKKIHRVIDLDDDEKSNKIELISEKFDVKSTSKKSVDEYSAEEDRSVEEFLEDYSIPNIGATTFIVNEDSESEPNQSVESELNRSLEIRTLTPSPEKSISQVQSEIGAQVEDEDLQKISMDQTPFLQALRRERESLCGQKQEFAEDVTAEMLDKLVEESYANAIDEITKNVGGDENVEEKVSNAISKPDASETNVKVDESFLEKHVDKFDNDWFDKELNFNRERLREAEELRLQQMRIEQEIEELQAQQHIPPYLYIREIPNKPPPPYTPPSEHSSVKIPNNESELRTLVSPAIQYICGSLRKGVRIDEVKQLPEYTPNGKSSTEITTYKKFIFDLTKEVARNILENNKTKKCLPWESSSKNSKPKLVPSEKFLSKMIENEVLVLFGFKSKINKEKLIIQWSRKKRNDFVDDLLIKELQDEEAEWTNYEEDENIIKNRITQNLLDDLIQDTVDGLQDAFRVKNNFASE